MQFHHGGLVLELPETWTDQSQLLFVGPPDEQQLLTANPVQRPTEAVSINFIESDPDGPRAVLALQAERLKELDERYELLDQQEFSCGLGPGWCSTQKLHIGDQAVLQLSVACEVDSVTVMATASAAEARFEQCEPQLRAVLESIRAAGADHAPQE